MFLLSLNLLVIVYTSKNSRASKMLDIVGICVNNFNETLVLKKMPYLRRPYNEQVIQFLSDADKFWYRALDPTFITPHFP